MLQISGDIGIYGERLAVALGFVTLATGLVTFVSCRSCLSFLSRLGLKNPMDMGWYHTFYRYHGYYLYIFLFALVLHLLTALMHTAIPTAGDPDAQIHLIILSFAFSSFVVVGIVLSSCRSLVALFNLFMEKGPLANKRYQMFYRYHSFYWLILALSATGHITAAYTHVGIWPN